MKNKHVTNYRYDSPGVCLITCPMGEFGYNPPVIMSAIRIFYPFTTRLFIISGNLKYQASQGPKISIISIDHDSKQENMLIRIIKQMLWQIKLSFHLFKIRKEIEFVIFYLGSVTYVLPALTARLTGKRILIHPTGIASRSAREIYARTVFGFGGRLFHFLLKLLESFSYRLADVIIIESKNQVNYYNLEKYLSKVKFVNYVFNTDLFRPLKKIADRKYSVGFIGRLGEEKGIMNLIKCLPILLKKYPDLKIFIGGDGELKTEVLQEISSQAIRDQVFFPGWISHEQLLKNYNEIKILVIPSYTEGGPTVLLEAMACGTVVVATRVGIVPDVIKDGINGFLLENNSPAYIATRILEVINNPALETIGQRACDTVKIGFSHESATNAYRAILTDLGSRFSHKIDYPIKSIQS